jgi:hypothetical protein
VAAQGRSRPLQACFQNRQAYFVLFSSSRTPNAFKQQHCVGFRKKKKIKAKFTAFLQKRKKNGLHFRASSKN